MYKVFEIYDCFDEWGTSGFYAGAESREDLIAHLPDIIGNKRTAKRIIKDDWRIKEIAHMFTDLPYEHLSGYGYVE